MDTTTRNVNKESNNLSHIVLSNPTQASTWFFAWLSKCIAGAFVGYCLKEFVFNPNKGQIEQTIHTNIISVGVSILILVVGSLYALHYVHFVLPVQKLHEELVFLVNVSTAKRFSPAPRKTTLRELGKLPPFSPTKFTDRKEARRQRSRTPEKRSSPSNKKRAKRRSRTPERVSIYNEGWGRKIGMKLWDDVVGSIDWYENNANGMNVREDRKELLNSLAYGSYVAVRRTNGKVVVGRIESNHRGVPLRRWSGADVTNWILGRSNLAMFPAIFELLKNRSPKLLMDQEFLKSKLDHSDYVTLETDLIACFEFEMRANEYFSNKK